MKSGGRMVRIFRSKRKTLALSVSRNGEVVVRAPYGVTEESIIAFVRKHERWIERRLAERNRAPLSLSDGSQVVLFGSAYRIESGERERFNGNSLILPAQERETAFARLLKRHACEVMQRFTEQIACIYGFSYAKVRVSSARGRWGSCNRKGVIAYTFRIAFLPPRLCEYVAVHELAHTVCFDHSPVFWKEVERVLPDWKNRRKELKSCSAVMNYL